MAERPRPGHFPPGTLVLSILLSTVLSSIAIPAGPATGEGIPSDDAAILHTLNRIAFGPRPGDIERVRHMGLDAYIERQLHPERVPDDATEARLQAFTTLTMSSATLASDIFIPALEMRRRQDRATAQAAASTAPAATPQAVRRPDASPDMARAAADQRRVATELAQARMIRAVASERQLQEVLVDFWFNHFNVFIGKSQVRQYLTEYERDVIRPNVLGSFRDLLGAVAHSPAMLLYLDNWQSAAPGEPPVVLDLERRLNDSRLSPAARQRLNERLLRARQAPRPRRGLNENYARELMELHTLGVDGGYSQEDVVALARILTGWTIDQPRQGGAYVFRAGAHDTGTKTLLGRSFAATGQSEGEFALDLLSAHPSTARHISYELAQRFVADVPPEALVARAARVFLDTKGDLREVVRAIITSPEFFAVESRRAKVKTPLEFVVSSARVSGAVVTSAQPLVAALGGLGMPLYECQAPTGYAVTAADWVNTGTLLGRMNFAAALVGGRAQPPQRAPDRAAVTAAASGPRGGRAPATPGPIHIDLAALAPDLSEATRVRVEERLLGGVVSDTTRQTLARAESPAQMVALALGSPEFQRR